MKHTLTVATIVSPSIGVADTFAGTAAECHDYFDRVAEQEDADVLPSDLRAQLATFRFAA